MIALMPAGSWLEISLSVSPTGGRTCQLFPRYLPEYPRRKGIHMGLDSSLTIYRTPTSDSIALTSIPDF